MAVKINRRRLQENIRRMTEMSISDVDDSYINLILSRLMTGYTTQTALINRGLKLYRVRKCDKPNLVSEISYPPSKFVTSYGRGNLIGQSVFYGSTLEQSALAEVDCKIGDRVILSEWEVASELQLNHIGFTQKTKKALNSTRDLHKIYGFVKNTHNYSKLNSMIHEYLSYIFSKPTEAGREQEQYKCSANLAQIMVHNKNYDGLLYPAVKLFGNCNNILLKTNSVDEKLKPIKASYASIVDIKYNTYYLDHIDTAFIHSTNVPIPWQ